MTLADIKLFERMVDDAIAAILQRDDEFCCSDRETEDAAADRAAFRAMADRVITVLKAHAEPAVTP